VIDLHFRLRIFLYICIGFYGNSFCVLHSPNLPILNTRDSKSQQSDFTSKNRKLDQIEICMQFNSINGNLNITNALR
jgi:hypothetical protein